MMKRKNKQSLIQKLNEQFIYLNFAIVIFLIVIPMSYYQLFVSSQYYKLERFIEETPNVTAHDIGEYVIEEGYDLRTDVGDVFDAKSNVCTVKNVEMQEKTNASSKKLVVTYNNGCEPMVIGLNYVLLHGFTVFYFSITIVSSIVVILANVYNMNGIKRRINRAFNEVEEQVEEIKLIGNKHQYHKKEAAFSEFQLLIDNIDELNNQINNYISERHTLVSTLNHELKSPINKMNSLIQAYQMQVPGYDDSEKVVEEITNELNVLLDIVNFTLDVFVKVNLRENSEINMEGLIQKILKRNEDKFALKGIDYKIVKYDNLTINSDVRIVELILSNIIENISKYAKEDTTFTISMSERSVVFRNRIRDTRNIGTQQGLKLSAQLVKSVGYNLNYAEENEEFKVTISQKKESK